MKRYLLIAVLLLPIFIANPASAAEWGIAPIFKNLSKFRPEDLVETVNLANSLNARIFTTLWGWHDLEEKAGVDNTPKQAGGVQYAITQGFEPYIGLSIINTVTRDMPSDLVRLDWTDPVLQQRLAQQIERLHQNIPYNLRTFVIGNEVDVYFENHPDEVDSYVALIGFVRGEVHKYWPQALVGPSLTFEGLHIKRTALVRRLLAASDAAFFTFYPIFDFIPANFNELPAMLDSMIQEAGEKPLYLQEVGYPSAAGLTSSEAMQARFFSIIIPAINARPQIRQAVIFCMHDFDDKVANMLIGYYGFSMAPDRWVKPFRDFLTSLGIRRSDGQTKEAWTVVSTLLTQR